MSAHPPVPLPAASAAGTGSAAAPYQPGDTVAGRYRILNPIAPGACGWVLQGREHDRDTDVAVKVIAADLLQTEDERARFLAAAARVTGIAHPGLATISEAGRDGTFAYYCMELVDGMTLRRVLDLRLESGPLFTLAEALSVLGQLADGLEALWRVGAHGALRPTNVLAVADGLKITGLPHHPGLPRRSFLARLARSRSLIYVAPEARAEGAPPNVRADVYSLAVIASEMLTGQPQAPDSEVWQRVATELPAGVISTLRRALSDAPADRFATAAALCSALRQAAGGAAELGSAGIRGFVAAESQPAPIALPGGDEEPVAFETDEDTTTEDDPREANRYASVDPGAGPGLQASAPPPSQGQGRPDAAPGCPPDGSPGSTPPPRPWRFARLERWQRHALVLVVPFLAGVIASLLLWPSDPQDSKSRGADPSASVAVQSTKPTDAEAAAATAETSPVSVATGAEPSSAAASESVRSACPEGMAAVAAGSFEMGSRPSDPRRGPGDLHARHVGLPAFCMDIYEYPNRQGATPLTEVDWMRARELCESEGKRLCDEAEWERVCRGPSQSRFPFGDPFDEAICNIGGAAGRGGGPGAVAPSGAFPRCRGGFGAVDLSGNVAEWTASRWSAQVSDRVVKGGAAGQSQHAGRCAARVNEATTTRRPTLGFRCCTDLQP